MNAHEIDRSKKLVSPRTLDFPPDESDRDLEQRVRIFLDGLNRYALRNLKLQVRNGWAVVSGTVGSFYEKQLASSCCQRVAGVRRVINNVTVVDGTTACRLHSPNQKGRNNVTTKNPVSD